MWWMFSAALAAPGVSLGEGVVLDVQRDALYLAVPGGGVEAVSVSSGASRWVSSSGDFPLASAGDLVITWKDSSAGSLRVVGLDATRKGGTAVRCADLTLPNGLIGAIDDRLGGSTTVTARVRDHQIEASWVAEAHYAGGAPPSDAMLAASNRSWGGSGRCASDGRWTDGPGPALTPTDREVPIELQGKAGFGQRFGSKWKIAYTAWDGAKGTFRLQTWDIPTATQVSDLALTELDDTSSFGFLSIDGAQVALVTQGAAASSRVFDAVTGQPVASLPSVALSTWARVGDTYVTSNGATVSGYDAAGKPLWSRSVRNRRYPGPYPP